ncbi:hypothetical protein [Enhydrobacter aerosaccus]|uniref:hypothetical protein n=1 Tax=Enhydrobacter aerosaccus TaxID=225324 RepID=UPI003AF3EC15
MRVDTRKWMLAKMLPKVYGEQADGRGEDAGRRGDVLQRSGARARLRADAGDEKRQERESQRDQ